MKKFILIILFALLVAFIKSLIEYKYFVDVDKPNIVVVDTSKIVELDTMFISESDDYISIGHKIYRQNCAACHSFDRDLAGPRITTRIGYTKMYNIISNITRLEKNKDPYTIKLLKEWDKKCGRMPEYDKVLSRKEIMMLISYLKYNLSQQKCIH